MDLWAETALWLKGVLFLPGWDELSLLGLIPPTIKIQLVVPIQVGTSPIQRMIEDMRKVHALHPEGVYVLPRDEEF